jgi:DNA polymerase I-like protein with 3'-5' exonuclease and polymerase domains
MWQHILPADVFQNYFKNVVQDTSSIFSNLPTTYYDVAWLAGSRVLSSLKSAKIDQARWQELAADSTQNQQSVESFKPGRTGYALRPEYDRFGTRTGRLTITSGPQILTLKKSNRNMLKSSFPDGTICSLDFRALEARIVLSEAGKCSDAEDMYGEIAQELFGGKVNRDAVKTAVISELYGISRSALAVRLQVTSDVLDNFIKVVRTHFGTAALKFRLKEELKKNGFIRNRFGRPLRLEESQDNLLVNTYSQSSGVDVAMLGFDSILQQLGTDGVRPLFVLHDAIILDVRGDRLSDVEQCTTVNIPTYSHVFPLKYEPIL